MVPAGWPPDVDVFAAPGVFPVDPDVVPGCEPHAASSSTAAISRSAFWLLCQPLFALLTKENFCSILECGNVSPCYEVEEVEDVGKEALLSPQTLRAEKLLLGCILRQPLVLIAARPLTPNDFSEAAHGIVLTTLRQLAEDGMPLDVPTLTTRLERTGQLERVGGPAFLAELARAAPAEVSMPQTAELARRILAGRGQASPSSSLSTSGEGEDRGKVANSLSTSGEGRGKVANSLSTSGEGRGKVANSLSTSGEGRGEANLEETRAQLEARVPTLQRAEMLLRQNLPPTLWIVPDLLPEGLTLLAAKPKLGKSWLALGLALAVASGGTALGRLAVERGAVLYLALEDSPKRLRQRLQQLLGDEAAPPALEVATEWPRLDADGLPLIESWLQGHPNARLVILDTLAKIRGAKSVGSYAEDYASLEAVQALAQRAGVAILVVHHTGKEHREDALDEVNATQGLNGVADNILVLRRQRGKLEASLIGDGRELNGVELALRFDAATGAWSITEPPEEEAKTPERTEVLRVLKASAEPMSTAQIAEAISKPASTVNRLLTRMAQAGEIRRKGYGLYIPHSLSELSE